MTIKVGDICHLKNYYGEYWAGKIIEIHKKIDDYEFRDPILYVTAINKRIPRFDITREYELKEINGEYWEI